MIPKKMIGASSTVIIALILLLLSPAPLAGALGDQLSERRPAPDQNELANDEAAAGEAASLPAHIRIVCDVPYGSDARQRFDVG